MSSPSQDEPDASPVLPEISNSSSENIAEVEEISKFSNDLALDAESVETEDHIMNETSEDMHDNEDHEMEEIVHTEEEVESEEIQIHSEEAPEEEEEEEEETPEVKYKPPASVPPLRPLNILPKPEQIPIAVKSVSGQPLILVPSGNSGGQTIKLVNPQGQEINFANYSLSRPIAVKTAGKTLTTNPVSQSKPIVMKKIITANAAQKAAAKPITFSKPTQQFVVVQKSGEQNQQVKLVQTASANNIATAALQTKTITLQQAQEMGLIPNAKIVQSGGSQPAKRTVLINKNQPKTIKIVSQGGQTPVVSAGNTKTIALTQLKSPTKILPAAMNTIQVGSKGAQRIIFKSGTGQHILPAGQLIQVAGTQGLASGQIHQINVPGKGMQYIKFVTTTSAEPSSSTVSLVNTVKTTTSTTTVTNAVVPDTKQIITTTKLVAKPVAASTTTKPTQVIMVPAGYIPTTLPQKVAIPAINKPPGGSQAKHVLTTVPRPNVPAPTTTESNTTTSSGSEKSPNANGIRPRKPCNCTKSQCLKLYCDCFANGEFCYLCNCMNCFNNLDNEDTRNLAIRACLERNPNAFRPKIGKAKDTGGDVLRKHTKGCNCKRSGCLKNYCECYEAKIACSNNCKCIGCRNIEENMDRKSMDVSTNLQKIGSETNSQKLYRKIFPQYRDSDHSPPSGRLRKSSSSRKQAISFITDDVIEATCQCLLTISDDADLNMQDEELTKRQIIEEFGGCLTEIIHCSLNRNI